jgi:ABC-2 type transport system ATP-binding protein
MYGMSDELITTRSKHLLELLELAPAAHQKAGNFSTGMKKRLTLARTLLHEPRVLFLDEPTSGLDPESALAVTQLIQKMARESGVTIFLCTHQLKYAEEISTLYGFMHQGKMIGFGTFEELLAKKQQSVTLKVRGENLVPLKSGNKNTDGSLSFPIKSDKDAAQIIDQLQQAGGQIFEANQCHWTLEELYFAWQKGVDQ